MNLSLIDNRAHASKAVLLGSHFSTGSFWKNIPSKIGKLRLPHLGQTVLALCSAMSQQSRECLPAVITQQINLVVAYVLSLPGSSAILPRLNAAAGAHQIFLVDWPPQATLRISLPHVHLLSPSSCASFA